MIVYVSMGPHIPGALPPYMCILKKQLLFEVIGDRDLSARFLIARRRLVRSRLLFIAALVEDQQRE